MGNSTQLDECSDLEVVEDRIADIRRWDRRFSSHAYFFVLDVLDFTIEKIERESDRAASRHVGGRELLAGVREVAARDFGPMAPVVFERWGVRSTDDFGEIVFNLIDAGLLTRRPEDSRLDFVDGYDFQRVFTEAFDRQLDRISHAAPAAVAQ